MASLKVLELNTEKTWRGGERHTYCTLKALKSLGIDVDLLARRDSPLAKKAKGLNITVYEVSNHLEALGFLIGRGKKYDVIHAQTPKTQNIALFSKPIHRRPIVCTRLVDFKPKGVLSRAKYKLTDRMVAINETIKDVLISAGVEKVKVIPIMYEPKKANTERARTLLRELGIDTSGKKVIATVSAFTPQKDPLTTVKVVEELSRRRRDFLFLHFGDGPMRSEVEREITDRDLEGFYHILGFVEDPEDFYPLFDVYVMTSLNEGTPL
ncbi:MAG TPA: glycosyltransferase, partial [Aquifex aeolicus]|nr:glycosyltransferase [Aquifex aeolicus]